MKITIAVPTYNRCQSLRQTLAAVARVRVPPDMRCELIVVDNASTDETPQMVRRLTMPNMTVRYVCEPRRGVAHSRNRALAEAGGEIILFMDDDVRPPLNWIEGMCEPILSGKGQAVAGGVKIAPHLLRPWMTPEHRAWLASTEGLKAENPEAIVSANTAFAREVLTKVPSFDTELGVGAMGFYEETLFSWQLKKAGVRIATAFDVVGEHHFDEARLSRSSFLGAAKGHGRCWAYVAHHWEHQTIPHPRRRLAECLLQLARERVRKRQECLSPEGIPEWEMRLVANYYIHRQYLIERKRPRNYEKHGLIKLRD